MSEYESPLFRVDWSLKEEKVQISRLIFIFVQGSVHASSVTGVCCAESLTLLSRRRLHLR